MVNANLGGDNVHRGALLGALLGAARPRAFLSEECTLRKELFDSEAVTEGARRFSELVCGFSEGERPVLAAPPARRPNAQVQVAKRKA